MTKSEVVRRMYRQHWWQFWRPRSSVPVVVLPLVKREPTDLLGYPFAREE